MNKLHALKIFVLMIALTFAILLVGCDISNTNTYYVNFLVNDNVYKTIAVKENETIDNEIFKEIKPAIDGYEFKYWLDGDDKFDETQKITKDLNLKAYFEKVTEKVVITIVSNNEIVNTIELEKGQKLSKLDDFVLEGYVFKGYYLGEELYDFDADVNENITLTAKWEKEAEKDITVKLYDGDELIDTIITKANVEVSLKKLTKEGYDFVGWSYLENVYNDKITLSEDAVLNAKWEVHLYTISFYDKDKLIETRKVEHGKDLLDIPTFVKDGYEFMGWDQELVNITSDLIVYADYYAIEYMITYHNCDKTSNVRKYTIESRPIVLSAAEKEGYVFGGWYLEDNFKTKVEVIETGTFGNLNLYARFLNTYSVYFSLDGGDFSSDVIESYNLKANSTGEFVITQYNTNYWELYKDNIFLMKKENDPKAIYSFRVGLKYNNGSFVITSLVKSGGSSNDLGDCDYVIVVAESNTAGCKELNFNNLKVGYKLSINVDIASLSEGAVNLKTLLFNDSLTEYKGNILEEQILPTPKKKRYIFKGWMTSENEIITKINNSSSKEIILKALWEKAEGTTEYEIDMISDELIEKIGRVVSKNIELPTYIEEFKATIKWTTSDENIISSTGVVKRPFGSNKTCTLTMSITIKEITQEYTVTVLVPRGYKDISKGGIIAGYNYTSITPSDVTLRKVDILYCAFGNVGANGHITNLSSIGSYLKNYIDKAHSYGDYVILSLNTSNLAIAASKQETIDVLVKDCLKAINNFGLDGIDVDWETPTQETKENYTALMKSLYTRVKANNPEHLVTTATAAGPWQYPRFDLENSIKYIDYINLMAYDLQTNSKATHQSALYKSTRGYTLGKCTIDETLPLYNNVNVPNEKIIVGLPFYGRKFKDTDGIGQSSSADGACTQSYIYENYLSKSVDGVTIGFDDECKVPYIYDANKRLFISYDDEKSIRIKTEYISMKGLAGMMYWQDGQDYNNKLLNAIYANKSTMKSTR